MNDHYAVKTTDPRKRSVLSWDTHAGEVVLAVETTIDLTGCTMLFVGDEEHFVLPPGTNPRRLVIKAPGLLRDHRAGTEVVASFLEEKGT